MEISIAICTWNRSKLLSETLSAFRDLKIPAELSWEIIVVDNNSTDETPQVLESFKSTLPLRSFFESRPGQTYARNRAIQEASGNFMFWTDDDVIPDPEWLTVTWRVFKEQQADFVYGKVKPIWLAPKPDWFNHEYFSGRFAILDHGSSSFMSSVPGRTFFGVNHAARLDVLRSLNGYREDLGLCSTEEGTVGGDDDTDLYERALKKNAKIIYEPDSLIWHKIDPARCHKRYHRLRSWNTKRSYILFNQNASPDAPRILALPRYLYRIALDDVWQYLLKTFKRDKSGQFHYELRLLLFLGALTESLRSRIQSSS